MKVKVLKQDRPDERILPQFNEQVAPADNFSDAFDYCREVGAPVTAIVNNEVWKLFPSGKAIPLGKL